MKYFNFLWILGVLMFMNCDGRQTQGEALQEAIQAFKAKHERQLLSEVKSISETSFEVVTDTIIDASQTRIKIKNHNSNGSSIDLSQVSEHVNNKDVEFDLVAEIEISKDAVSVLELIIKADDFLLAENSAFWHDATLEQVWVYQEACTLEETHLRVSFVNTITKDYKLYEMIVDGFGAYNFNLLEETV